jgi:hypothetical protein
VDSRKYIKKEVLLAFKALHQKIDSVKEKVERLCEQTAGCLESKCAQQNKEGAHKTKKNKLH